MFLSKTLNPLLSTSLTLEDRKHPNLTEICSLGRRASTLTNRTTKLSFWQNVQVIGDMD